MIGRVLVCLSRFFKVHHSTTARPIQLKLGTVFNYKLNSRSTVEFSDSIRILIFVIGHVLVCLSRFFEVHHSTTARLIRFKLGTMINFKLNSRSTVEFFGSDQSSFIEVRLSTTARLIRFKLGTTLTYEVNSRSTVEFFVYDQFIDHDIDFCDVLKYFLCMNK